MIDFYLIELHYLRNSNISFNLFTSGLQAIKYITLKYQNWKLRWVLRSPPRNTKLIKIALSRNLPSECSQRRCPHCLALFLLKTFLMNFCFVPLPRASTSCLCLVPLVLSKNPSICRRICNSSQKSDHLSLLLRRNACATKPASQPSPPAQSARAVSFQSARRTFFKKKFSVKATICW